MMPMLRAPRLLAFVPLFASAGAEAVDLYPTDRCVADKLEATARACEQVLGAAALRALSGQAGLHGNFLARSRDALSAAFDAAEAASSEAGVDCAQTTATADAVADLLEAGAEEIADGLSGAGANGPAGRACESSLLRAAAAACGGLVVDDAWHLRVRDLDRDRAALGRMDSRVLARFRGLLERAERRSCSAPGGDEAFESQVVGLADRAVLAATVSPQVASEWTMVTPDTQVEYLGQTLRPICSRGTPWVFFAKRGTVNKLLVYYQGGGACWDYFTCGPLQTFKSSTGPGDNPANFQSGFGDLSNPENPFRDWNAVFVPYCTGDVHWGNGTYEHVYNTGRVTIEHRGRVNAAVAEKWAREHFVNPDQVFVTGSSAGSYGAIANAYPLMEQLYPSTEFAVLGDAGNGVITQEFLENDIAKWNIQSALPSWIPELNVPLTELSAADLWVQAGIYYPRSRFANYTTAFDGGTGGQAGFYNVMLNPGFPLIWPEYWRASCAWNAGMRALALDAAARAENYRYYIGSGARHTMWGANKVYGDTTGGVPTIVSWVRGMLAGSDAWTNVETSDPGLLLQGDPRPNPAQPPYTAPAPPEAPFGRIVCEDPPPTE